MGKEMKTVRLEKYKADTPPIIVGEVKKSPPRMRDVKSKERMKTVTTSNKGTTTCETSGNVMKLCVNLMPVLAAAREPVDEEEGEDEEEEEKEEETSCTRAEDPKTSDTQDSSITKSKQQTFNRSDSNAGLTNESKHSLNPLFVLPPITEPAPAPECCNHHRTKRFPTPLPPIGSSEKTTTTATPPSSTGGGDTAATGQASDSRPWIDNVLFSKSRSAEFCLPDISLSSLEALLQTVTQKLARKRRGLGDEEGRWRRVQSDHLLTTFSEQRLRENTVGQQIDAGGAATEPSVIGHSVIRQRRLPPQPALILTMTKKNLPTYTMMQ